MNTATAGFVFVRTFNLIDLEVPFDPAWRNGTGYYNRLMSAELGLRVGEIAKTRDVLPNNRRIIIIALPGGKNAVTFERYTPEDDSVTDGVIVVGNIPYVVANIFNGSLNSALQADALECLYGGFDLKNNLGARLARFLKEYKTCDQVC